MKRDYNVPEQFITSSEAQFVYVVPELFSNSANMIMQAAISHRNESGLPTVYVVRKGTELPVEFYRFDLVPKEDIIYIKSDNDLTDKNLINQVAHRIHFYKERMPEKN